MQRNIKLLLEYDGTNFVGWQVQASGRSVQGELENALRRLLQESVTVIGAGRTDSGVHARGQIANFPTTSSRSVQEIHRAMDALLPDDIIVREVGEVPLDFHARFSARERRYRYFISQKKLAVQRQYSWHVSYQLDVERMRRATEPLLGQHDFEGFSKTDSGIENYVCTVRGADWCEDQSLLIFEIRADHFVRGMVRSLVGTMVDVGRGYRTIEQFQDILLMKDRSKAGMLAPARGLFLEEVLY